MNSELETLIGCVVERIVRDEDFISLGFSNGSRLTAHAGYHEFSTNYLSREVVVGAKIEEISVLSEYLSCFFDNGVELRVNTLPDAKYGVEAAEIMTIDKKIVVWN